MEFILISDSKIKVMLTAKDLARFELEADDLDYANTETKRMFWDVLSRAKRRTGFDTDGERVVVQLYPSKEGGCEIFVTKIGSIYHSESDEDAYDTPRTALTEIALKKKKEPPKKKYIPTVISFDELRDMIALCRALYRVGYSSESRAYLSEGRRFYLVLSDKQGEASLHDKYPFISEFGEEESGESSQHFLSEHASLICEKEAVGTLALC